MKDVKLNIQIFFNDFDKEITDSFKEIAVFIGNLFEYYLPPVKVKKVRKIIAEFSSEPDVFEIIPADFNNIIITIRRTFDFEKFDKMSLTEKEGYLLFSLTSNLKLVFEKLEINIDGLEVAYSQIIERKFKLMVDLCGGEKLNKSKNITAQIVAEYFIGYILISVVFHKTDNAFIRKVGLFKTLPHWIFYQQLVRKAQWLDNEVFQILSKTNEICFLIKIDGTVATLFNPKDRDIDGIKEEITTLTKELLIEI